MASEPPGTAVSQFCKATHVLSLLEFSLPQEPVCFSSRAQIAGLVGLFVFVIVLTFSYFHDVSFREASLVAQRLKRLPAMWEIWVRSLGWEDPLEKETATHSSILAWRIPWTEEPGRLQSMGSQRVRQD